MASGGIGNQSLATLFQARLDTVDGVSALLWLRPYQGNKVVISGQTLKSLGAGIACNVTFNLIDAAGADSGAPGAANTLYYVYVSNILATFSPETLRLSATPPTPVNGVRYLGNTGNALNWRFVGWVQLNATPNFESSLTSRTIVNYYNRTLLPLLAFKTTDTNYNSLVWALLHADYTLKFISNGEDAVTIDATGTAPVPANNYFGVGVHFDADAAPLNATICGPAIGSFYGQLSAYFVGLLSEGFHTSDLFAVYQGAGSVTFVGPDVLIATGAPVTQITGSVFC